MEKVILNATGGEWSVECPHCGEGYQWQRDPLNTHEVGEIFDMNCDGQEGCGEEFQVEVK